MRNRLISESDIVKIVEQLDELLPSNSINKQGDEFRTEI